MPNELGFIKLDQEPKEDLGFAPIEQTPTDLGFVKTDVGGRNLGFINLDKQAAPEVEQDLGKQVALGVRESLVPFGLEAEEIREGAPRTGAEIVARAGSNIVTDIATSVAAGAIVGSIVPGPGTLAGAAAGLGTAVTLGVYRALGMETVMSKAQNRDFSLGMAGLNTFVEVNPLLKIGGKGVKFATQAALQASQAGAYGADLKTSLIAGAAGGSLSTLAHKHAVDVRQLRTAGVVANLVDENSTSKGIEATVEFLQKGDNSAKLMKRAHKALDQNADYEDALRGRVVLKEGLDQDAFEKVYEQKAFAKAIKKHEYISELKRLRAMGRKPGIEDAKRSAAELRYMQEGEDFARFVVGNKKARELTGDKLFDAARKSLQGTGLDEGQAWQLYRNQKYIKQGMKELTEQQQRKLGVKDPLESPMFRSLGDLTYVARAQDEITGLDVEHAVRQLIQAGDEHSAFMQDVTMRVNSLVSKIDKAGVSREFVSKAMRGKDLVGNRIRVRDLPEAQQDLLVEVRDIMDHIRSVGIGKGLDIGAIDNYFTRLSVDQVELVRRVRKAYSDSDPTSIRTSRSPEDRELNRLLTKAYNKKLKTNSDVTKAFDLIQNPSFLKEAVGYEASAAFARKGHFPELLREHDVGRALLYYANNTGKGAAIDPAIRQMQMYIPILHDMKWGKSAEYWQKFLGQMSGQPSEFQAKLMQQTNQWKIHVAKQLENEDMGWLAQKGWKAAGLAPDIAGFMMAQMYPNFLGFRIRPVLRNMTQPTLLTAPELGEGYGHGVIARATARMLKDKAKGVNLERVLTEEGLFPGKFVGEGFNVFERSLRNSVAKPLVELSERLGRTGMYLYGKSDVINRYITRLAAKELTKDLLAGSTKTKGFMKNMTAGGRHKLARIMERGTPEEVEKYVTHYLVGKTQFNYGSHAMNQFGREYGKLVSMFSKWPASIGSNIREDLVIKGAKAGSWSITKKFLAPFALAGVINQTMFDTEGSPRQRALIGRSVQRWTPLGAMQLSVPPAFAIPGKLVQAGYKAFETDLDGGVVEYLREGPGKPLVGSVGALVPLGYGMYEGYDKGRMIITGEK